MVSSLFEKTPGVAAVVWMPRGHLIAAVIGSHIAGPSASRVCVTPGRLAGTLGCPSQVAGRELLAPLRMSRTVIAEVERSNQPAATVRRPPVEEDLCQKLDTNDGSCCTSMMRLCCKLRSTGNCRNSSD